MRSLPEKENDIGLVVSGCITHRVPFTLEEEIMKYEEYIFFQVRPIVLPKGLKPVPLSQIRAMQGIKPMAQV